MGGLILVMVHDLISDLVNDHLFSVKDYLF